jgi:hypothetical protein
MILWIPKVQERTLKELANTACVLWGRGAWTRGECPPRPPVVIPIDP